MNIYIDIDGPLIRNGQPTAHCFEFLRWAVEFHRPQGRRASCFHEDRSEIAYDLAQLARAIAPRRRSLSVEVSAERSGRVINATQVINGRHVQVQRRRTFAIHIG